MNKYPSIVEEIHSEFNTASEKLLAEAEEFFKNVTAPNLQKASLLSKLGFTKTREAVEAQEYTREERKKKTVMENLRYYSMHYPNNKFITEKQVFDICEKYDLICGEVSRYKGFVPQEKLDHIAAFNLKEQDVPSVSFEVFSNISDVSGMYIDESDLTELGKEQLQNNSFDFFITDESGIHSYAYRLVTKECEARFNGIRFARFRTYQGAKTLQICAPEKDMDTSGMTVVNRKLIHVPDPVVLQPVKGGYLIVAAWGDEASDPIVVNQINN